MEKLCGHSLTGGCHLEKCPNRHPVDPEQAKKQHAAKKVFTLCSKGTACRDKGCKHLHLELAQAELEQSSNSSVGSSHSAAELRVPPSGTTPMRPVPAPSPPKAAPAPKRGNDRQDRGNDRRPRESERSGPQADRFPRSPAEHHLERIRMKLRAILRAKDAFRTLASTLNVPDAAEKAEKAERMYQDINVTLAGLAETLDGYMSVLGAKASEDDDE